MPLKHNQNRLLSLMSMRDLETANRVQFHHIGELLEDLHCKALEDQKDLKIADSLMREFRSGRVKAIPIDLVIESIELADVR